MAAMVGAQWDIVLFRGAVIVLITQQVVISVTVYKGGDDGSSKQWRIRTRTLRVIIPLMFGAISCSE